MSLWESHTSVSLLTTSPETRQCDICEKIRGEKIRGEIEPNEPWYAGRFSDIDVCSECYPFFYDNLTNYTENGHYRYCDVCIQDIGENAYYRNDEAGYDVCEMCYITKQPFGVNINQSGIQTLREHYIIAKHLSESEYTSSNLLADITAERNREFIELLKYLVRLPDTYDNILEWTLITDLIQCANHDALCGFAVNVIDPTHPVASVVSDNHGRIAMNVIYDNYDDYLRENEEYFVKNTDEIDFSEYIREKHGIRFYYG